MSPTRTPSIANAFGMVEPVPALSGCNMFACFHYHVVKSIEEVDLHGPLVMFRFIGAHNISWRADDWVWRMSREYEVEGSEASPTMKLYIIIVSHTIVLRLGASQFRRGVKEARAWRGTNKCIVDE